MVFAVILYCQVMGIELIMGVLFLGMAVPGGAPLGSGLVDKLELFVSAVLLPSFILSIGRKVNVYGITLSNFGKVELFILGAFLGKVVGAMVPSIYRKFPVVDAFLIGLLMSCQGFIDISFFSHALHHKVRTTTPMLIVISVIQMLNFDMFTVFKKFFLFNNLCLNTWNALLLNFFHKSSNLDWTSKSNRGGEKCTARIWPLANMTIHLAIGLAMHWSIQRVNGHWNLAWKVAPCREFF